MTKRAGLQQQFRLSLYMSLLLLLLFRLDKTGQFRYLLDTFQFVCRMAKKKHEGHFVPAIESR